MTVKMGVKGGGGVERVRSKEKILYLYCKKRKKEFEAHNRYIAMLEIQEYLT